MVLFRKPVAVSFVLLIGSACSSPRPAVAPPSAAPIPDAEQREPAALGRKAERQNDLCVCVTGTTPESQTHFFRLGCSLWFNRQSCEQRRRIALDSGTKFSDLITDDFQGSRVVVGYVGHWSGTAQTLDWLDSEILPASSRHELDLRIDNTACRGGDNPRALQVGVEDLRRRYPVPNLELRVNQAISTGLWDPFLPGKNNFWIEHRGGMQSNEPGSGLLLPSCREFENRSCWGWAQQNETGFCEEVKDGARSRVLLSCTAVDHQAWRFRDAPADKGAVALQKGPQYYWKRISISGADLRIREEAKQEHAAALRIGLRNNRFHDRWVEPLMYGSELPSQLMANLELILREAFLAALPPVVHLDTGDESIDEKVLSRGDFSIDDVVIKERTPQYRGKGFVLEARTTGKEGEAAWIQVGRYQSREAAQAAFKQVREDPFVLKSSRFP